MCMLNPVTLHVPHSLAESCCASMTTESVYMEGALSQTTALFRANKHMIYILILLKLTYKYLYSELVYTNSYKPKKYNQNFKI